MPSISLLLRSIGLLAAAVSPVAAQTWTNCNPMNRTDCPADPAFGTSHQWNFTKSLDEVVWNTTTGSLQFNDEGADFVIAQRLQSPTVTSNFYIFWGRCEVWMKAAAGGGIVSTVVLQSDDLDEVDWEFVGYNTTSVQSNYYGKGNASTYNRVGYHNINGDATTEFHNYTTHWTNETIEWHIDGDLVRTLAYADALNGQNYPQTPMQVKIGIWPAGDPKNAQGTIEWAGGEVDYGAGPYTMTVKNVSVADYSSGKEYKYGDKTGSWESIEVVSGNSTVKQELNKPPAKSVSQKFAELSTGAKAGIFGGIGGASALALGILAFCCVKQRKAGRMEYSKENDKFLAERGQMLNFQSDWGKGRGYTQVHTT